MALNTFLASSCVGFTLPYHTEPPAFDFPAAYARICETVMRVAPPKAELVFPLGGTRVKSIDTPPIGAGALILLPPRAGLLKNTSSAVASICAFSIAFIVAPDASAALMSLVTKFFRGADAAGEGG